jgi:hypothetical protein
LQQPYGGPGIVVFKREKQELDFKASLDYIDYQLANSSPTNRPFGFIFGETDVQTFTHGILLSEQAAITPAWADTSAYSAFASAALTFPSIVIWVSTGRARQVPEHSASGFEKKHVPVHSRRHVLVQ